MNKGKIVFVYGKGGSGKDTLVDNLVGDKELPKALGNAVALREVVRLTTRPKRVGEVSGIDYDFVDGSSYLEMGDEDFIEREVVQLNNGDKWHYATEKSSLLKDGFINVISGSEAVLTGFYFSEYIQDNFDLILVLLEVDQEVQFQRMKDRGDDPAIVLERLEDEGRLGLYSTKVSKKYFEDSHCKLISVDTSNLSKEEVFKEVKSQLIQLEKGVM